MSNIGATSDPGSSGEDLYYVLDGQETIGPVPASSVQAMAANGSLKPDSNVSRVGETDWQRASQFAFLASYFAPSASSTVGTPYVGFWLRLAAYFVDYIIVNLATLPLSLVVGVVLGAVMKGQGQDTDTISTVSAVVGGVLGLVVTLLYHAGFLASRWQATPGKRLLGMHVVRTDGQRIGWLLGLGRYLSYILSSLILGIGFLMIGWTDQKKGLHDIICNTRVVRGRPGPGNRVVDAF